ncbi:hypothetical protein B1B_00687, partial [mine drainage metagenome]
MPTPRQEAALAVADAFTGLLHAIDALEWPRVRSALADRVATDYTSLFGGSPAERTADELIRVWEGLLPGFDATQHLTGPIHAVPIEGGVRAT